MTPLLCPYRFRSRFPVESNFDAADLFGADCDVEEYFVGDEGAFCGGDELGEEKDGKEED